MAHLYVVATPIGNLKDITLRALEILNKVDFILAEDTRITKRLLDRFQIKKPIISYHQHSKIQKINYIISLLKEEKNLALVSDAGTPGISDPGNLLIKELISQLNDKVKIIPIPGASALTAAASIASFPMDRFLFLGFPPNKRKRKKFFEEVINSKYPVIFYESPYRIIKTLKELEFVKIRAQIGENSPKVMVCRELTKKFEIVYRGKIKEVIATLESDKKNLKGEFVVIYYE